jgi:DNA-binding NtrC family response regulator
MPDPETTAVPVTEAVTRPAGSLRGSRVLLIDDEPSVALSIADSLTEAGAEVSTCRSLAQARQLADRARFDVVIGDVRLPDGSGRDLLAGVPGDPSAPAVILTAADGDLDAAAKALCDGAFDYVFKPFPVEKIVRAAHHAWRIASLERVLDGLRCVTAGDGIRPLAQAVDELEGWFMRAILDRFRGSRAELAAALGISPERLAHKLARHGLEVGTSPTR